MRKKMEHFLGGKNIVIILKTTHRRRPQLSQASVFPRPGMSCARDLKRKGDMLSKNLSPSNRGEQNKKEIAVQKITRSPSSMEGDMEEECTHGYPQRTRFTEPLPSEREHL